MVQKDNTYRNKRKQNVFSKCFSHIAIKYKYLSVYFKNNHDEIARINIESIKSISIIASIISLVLLLVLPYIIPKWKASFSHYLIVPSYSIFLVFSLIYGKKQKLNYYVVIAVCIIFYIDMISLMIYVSVFPFPSNPEIFLTLIIMVLPVLFIIPTPILLILTLISVLVFNYLVSNFKDPSCVSHDMASSISACLLSYGFLIFVTNLRIKANHSKIQFKELSETDGLTKLLNKTGFACTASTYLKNRAHNENCVLLVIDMDNFKLVNDTLGHLVGDQLLQGFADCLRRTFRSTDLISRFGGDEFCVLIKNVQDTVLVTSKTNLLLNSVKDILEDTKNLNISCSIGAAICCEKDTSFENLFRTADAALYKVKESGKARCVIELGIK